MSSYGALDTTHLSRLRNSVDWSVGEMRTRREQRMKLLKKLVGPYFGKDGSNQKRPVNLIELGVDIFTRGLASHQPQAMVSSDYEELTPTAADFEIVLNRRITRMKLQASLNICAIEALFTIGVMVVGIAVDGEFDPGQVFAEPVLFPDLILDMNAKSWEQQAYIGHKFLVPLETVAGDDSYDAKARDKFVAYEQSRFESGDQDWQRTRREDYCDMVELSQLYLPRQNRVLVLTSDGRRKPLLDNEWTGPEGGPYHPLSFGVVPGNIFPRAPVPMWHDLDDIANKCFSKMARQSTRCKTVGLTQNPDDAASISNGDDGDIVSVSSPDAVVEKSFGGMDPKIAGMFQLAKAMLTYTGGNWDALAGLAPQAETLGQDQLLAAGAGGRMKDMQQAMTDFESKIVNDIGFWVWQDPLSQERINKKLEGTDYSIPAIWSPETRKGEFFQLNLSANPYAKINRSPSEQGQALTQVLTSILLPSLPFMQQGSPVDWEAFFDLLARYMHLPELKEIIRWPGGGTAPQSMPETPKQSPNTTRTYVRQNQSGGRESSVDRILSQMLSSNPGSPQPATQQQVA